MLGRELRWFLNSGNSTLRQTVAQAAVHITFDWTRHEWTIRDTGGLPPLFTDPHLGPLQPWL